MSPNWMTSYTYYIYIYYNIIFTAEGRLTIKVTSGNYHILSPKRYSKILFVIGHQVLKLFSLLCGVVDVIFCSMREADEQIQTQINYLSADVIVINICSFFLLNHKFNILTDSLEVMLNIVQTSLD